MKTIKKIAFALAVVAALLSVTGCLTEDFSGTAYDPEFVRLPHQISYGTITRIEEVTIQGKGGIAGAAAGGIVGGVAGNMIGGGSGNTLATGLGAVGGAVAGSMLQKRLTTQKSWEFEIKLDNGNMLSIVQSPGNDNFSIGQRVRVLTANTGVSRIRPE